MPPLRRLAATVLATSAAIGGLSALAPSPASAAPTGCYSKTVFMGNAAASWCSGGSGQHRAVARCSNGDTVYGAWKSPGSGNQNASEAYCDRWNVPPWGWWVRAHWYQTR